MNTNTRLAHSGLRNALPLALVLLTGLGLALPHLRDEVWYDESYTLDYFATGNLGHAFTRYHEPNNHILFSALLSVWRGVTDAAPVLRLLPLMFFLVALVLLAAGAARLAGGVAGMLAGMLFATSHVTLNFALQLRGYGPSWLPVGGGLLVLILFLA